MAATKLLDVAELITLRGGRVHLAEEVEATPRALPTGWPELDALLPDGGWPLGVVELAAPRARGGITSLALSAVRAAQARDGRAYCAWIDEAASLYAPGLAGAGVDLARLLVVRPPPGERSRAAWKVAQSGAFAVVVIDMAGDEAEGGRTRNEVPLLRKLALAAEEGGATVMLLADAEAPRPLPWPVSLRLEVRRTAPGALAVRVAKDRRGRIGVAKAVPLATRPGLDGRRAG